MLARLYFLQWLVSLFGWLFLVWHIERLTSFFPVLSSDFFHISLNIVGDQNTQINKLKEK